MKSERVEIMQKLLLWFAVIAFSVAWGFSAALADDDEGLQSVQISGATSVNDGSSVQLRASATIGSDTRDITTSSRTRWSLSSTTYASVSGGRVTAKNLSSCQNQNATVNISYSRDGTTRTDTHNVSLIENECSVPPPPAVTLSGLTISGPGSLGANSTTPYTATASFSNGTSQNVTAGATWGENSTYSTISAGGVLTTTAPTTNQSVTVSAGYTSGGFTRNATLPVTISAATAPPPPIQGSHAGRFTSYGGATTCLPCHRAQAVQMYNSEHYQWSGKLGKINDFCIYPDPNAIGKLTNTQGFQVDGGCFKCHPGLGATPTKVATPSDTDLSNIDCLVCHSPQYKRTVDPVTKAKFIPDEAGMGMPILDAAVDIQKTSRATCLNCHTKSGGGDNNKRGDIEEAHRNVTDRNFDVHMYGGSTNANMNCTACHTVSSHKISGKGMDLRVEEGTKVECSSCHTTAPHKATTTLNSTNATYLNTHTKRVNCTTCHIPQYAKTAATDMFRDWSAHGELNTSTWLYDPVRSLQKALTPSYVWWNGQNQFYNFNTAVAPAADGKVLMAGPTVAAATTAGAKIYPVKIHEALQPIDTVTRKLLPVKISQFYMQGDLINAIPLGQDAVGWPRNPYEFQRTKRVMGLFHEVSPKTAAIGYNNCNACHNTTTPKVPLKALGYTAKTGMTVNQVCSQCHGSENYSFNTAHTRSEHTREDCSRCHNFSEAQ